MILEEQRESIEHANRGRETRKIEWTRDALELFAHQPDLEAKKSFANHMQAMIASRKKRNGQQVHRGVDNPPPGTTVKMVEKGSPEEEQPLTTEDVRTRSEPSLLANSGPHTSLFSLPQGGGSQTGALAPIFCAESHSQNLEEEAPSNADDSGQSLRTSQ
jgi:hypothetical protein